MKPWIVLFTSLALVPIAACAAPPNGAGRDFLGNVFPPECADLSDIKIPVIEVRGDWLDRAAGETADVHGLWSKARVIYVREGLSPETRAAVIEHERCHEKMYRLTGNPGWHD